MGNIIINFNTVDPAPANGYRIKYRKVGDSTYTVVSPNPTTSPATITGVDNSFSYEGTIQSDCSNGIYSTAVSFSVDPCVGDDKKVVNGVCETGTRLNISSEDLGGGSFACHYKYVFSDSTLSAEFVEITSSACTT